MSSGEELNPTHAQIFTLSHLYFEDSHKIRMFNTFHTSSHVVQPVAISLRHLINILPFSKASETLSPEDVHNQLNVLVKHGFLKQELEHQNGEYTTFFSITSRGTLFVKGYIAKLSSAIKDKKINDQDIDRAEGNNEVKEYFKETWRKIKDKSQEEIANTLFSALRTYGPALIILLASL
jgi:hypothetical protein